MKKIIKPYAKEEMFTYLQRFDKGEKPRIVLLGTDSKRTLNTLNFLYYQYKRYKLGNPVYKSYKKWFDLYSSEKQNGVSKPYSTPPPERATDNRQFAKARSGISFVSTGYC